MERNINVEAINIQPFRQHCTNVGGIKYYLYLIVFCIETSVFLHYKSAVSAWVWVCDRDVCVYLKAKESYNNHSSFKFNHKLLINQMDLHGSSSSCIMRGSRGGVGVMVVSARETLLCGGFLLDHELLTWQNTLDL